MIEEANDLLKFITKQSSREEFIYQVLDVKYVEKGRGYRRVFSDIKREYGKVFSIRNFPFLSTNILTMMASFSLKSASPDYSIMLA